MKCDTCKFMFFEGGSNNPDNGNPYPFACCTKDKWEGLDMVDPEHDPWEDCEDYVISFNGWFNIVLTHLSSANIEICPTIDWNEYKKVKASLKPYFDKNILPENAANEFNITYTKK